MTQSPGFIRQLREYSIKPGLLCCGHVAILVSDIAFVVSFSFGNKKNPSRINMDICIEKRTMKRMKKEASWLGILMGEEGGDTVGKSF